MAVEYIPLAVLAATAPKAVVKLIEAIQQGVGTATEPYFIRKKGEAAADAEAYRMKKLAATLKEIGQEQPPTFEFQEGQLALTSNTAPPDLDTRYLLRSEYQASRKQHNVESVTSAAVEELLNDPEVETLNPEGSPDADWVSKFFDAIEDVSDEDMQRLWGRVLAGEVKQPKTFSLRTLEFLKTLSKAEADLFARVASYSAEGAGKLFVGNFTSSPLQDKFDISLLDIVTLREIGLILPEALQFQMSVEKNKISKFIYQGHLVGVEHEATIGIAVLIFSRTASELVRLLPRGEPNLEYLELLLAPIENQASEIWIAPPSGVTDEGVTFNAENRKFLKTKPTENKND